MAISKKARLAGVRDRVGNSAWGKRFRRIRGARAAHKAIRASGRVPGEEARAAALRNRKARKEAKERERMIGAAARKGTTNMEGI